MITARTELICHDLRPQPAHPEISRRYAGRVQRELYTSERFRIWFRTELPSIQATQYSVHGRPLVEASHILSRFAAGARLTVEPAEDTPGDIKLLEPLQSAIWELKSGDVRIFGWFHAFDCFVAYSGDDASYTKAANGYQRHIGDALAFLSACQLSALIGDHHHVLTL